MTDPQETSENIAAAAHSGGEPDEVHDEGGRNGSDVGGPDAAIESSAENAVTGDSSVDSEESPDDQAVNPL